jgi:hypothetical protein
MTAKLTDETGRNSLDPANAPVSLPPASFDLDKLTGASARVVAAAPEKRDAAVAKALDGALPKGDADAGARDRMKGSDPSDQAGFVKREVEHESIDGLVENLRVFDPSKADEQAPDQPVPAAPIAPSDQAKGE